MKVAVMGYGTVGSGVAEVIETHAKSIVKRTDGEMLEVAKILDLRDFPMISMQTFSQRILTIF